MNLQFLAISDTHLGEDPSLLNYPEGRVRLVEALGELFGKGAIVEEVGLMGDIPDRTLSSTQQMTSETRALVGALRSALNVKSFVYLPTGPSASPTSLSPASPSTARAFSSRRRSTSKTARSASHPRPVPPPGLPPR